MAKPIIMFRSDTRPYLRFTAIDGDGNPVALHGIDDIQIFVCRRQSTEILITGLCDIVDADNGVYEFRPSSVDTNRVGTFLFEFLFTWNGGSTQRVRSENGAPFVLILKPGLV